MSGRKAVLKPEKEKSLERRHPWIFSGAVASLPGDAAPGELLPVYSHEGKWLALAYFHPGHSLAGRIVSFEEAPIETVIRDRIGKAVLLRTEMFDTEKTNGYRLINAEGDGLPGLVVDRYGDVFVLQITTQGMERLRPIIIKCLQEKLSPRGLYEKSRGQGRMLEGLEEKEGNLWGNTPDEVEILENGHRFIVSLKDGQKTGFFFDQREMRSWVASRAKRKKVLNCFAYSGGFSIAALTGGALHVDSVDTCPYAAALAEKNVACNGHGSNRHTFYQEDVFSYLMKNDLSSYDIIILDPPAFAKKRSDVDNACRGYKQLMRQVMQSAKQGALLLTCSCSYYIDESLFQNIAGQAACEAGRSAAVIGTHIQASDHPYHLAHPEGRYLKSLILAL